MALGRRTAVVSAVLAAALIGIGPLAAMARPADQPCPREDGNPEDGHGQDDDVLEGLVGLIPCIPFTTTTTATTTSTTSTTTSTTSTTTSTTSTTTSTTSTTTSTTSTTTSTTSTTTSTTSTTVPNTTTTTPAGGSGGGEPSAPPPRAEVGLNTIDLAVMPPSLAGAVVIVTKMGDVPATPAAEIPESFSVRIDHLLGPVVPPALADAVVSPIVVLRALVAAMTSSSESLIVPGVVVLVGAGLPRRKRPTPDHALTSHPVDPWFP